MNSTPQPPSAAGEHFADGEGSSPPCRLSGGAPSGIATSRSLSCTPRWRSRRSSPTGTVTADGRRKHAVALPGNGRGVLCTRPLHGLPPSAERDQQRKKHDEPNHSQ